MKRISELNEDINEEKSVSEPILSIRNLNTYFYTYAGIVKALDGVSLDIYPGETVGLVGETGCGKSVTALSILRLIDPPGRIEEGEILFKKENLLEKTEDEMRRIRGHKIAMVFQDPTTYLNPVLTVGEQIREAIREHQKLEGSNSKEKVRDKVVEALRTVRLPDPERIINQYSHELSTGMRQRALIAMMISCDPELLIADEATTALDVTIQAQILALFEELKKTMGLSMLFITHDFGIVAEMCDRITVMYAGNVAELGEKMDIFDNPLHPYTASLLKALPKHGHARARIEYLETIPGSVPDLINPPRGCRFHPRCSLKKDICATEKPEMSEVKEGHYVSCHLFKKDG